MARAQRAPRKMFRDQGGLNAIDQPFQLAEIGAQAIRRAERKADPMQADGIVHADLLKHMQVVAAVAEVVLAVHLQPIDCGCESRNSG